jgi:hypothetical protein
MILGSKLAHSVTSQAIEEVLVEAQHIAHTCPVELRCDGHFSYPPAVTAAFRGKTKLSVHKREGEKSQDQSIEGTFSQLRNRLNGLRGLHSLKRSPILIKGLILDYNFARPSEVLGGKTPAELAIRRKKTLDDQHGWKMLLNVAEHYKRAILFFRNRNQYPRKEMQSTLGSFLSSSQSSLEKHCLQSRTLKKRFVRSQAFITLDDFCT